MTAQPVYAHVQLQTQKRRFTVHESKRGGLEELFHGTDLVHLSFLDSIEIEKEAALDIQKELRRIGVARSILFPDIEGLGSELATRFAHPYFKLS